MTDIDHMGLVCSFHHKRIHQHDYVLNRTENGEVTVTDRHQQIILDSRRAGPEPPDEQHLKQKHKNRDRKQTSGTKPIRGPSQDTYDPLTPFVLDNIIYHLDQLDNQDTD